MDWAKKDAFFAAKLPKERVTIEGVGDVMVHGLSLYDKEQWQQDSFKYDAESKSVFMKDSEVQLLLLTVHDQHGKKFFAKEDFGRLRNHPCLYLKELLKVARRLSAIGEDEIKDLVKNSPPAPAPQSEGSGSD